MEDSIRDADTVESKPAWETPEMSIEAVASLSEANFSGTGIDAGSGS